MDICNYFGKDNIALVAVSLGNSNSKVAYELAVHSKLPTKEFLGKVHILSFEEEYLNDRVLYEEQENIYIHSYQKDIFSKLNYCEKEIIIIDDLSNAMEFIPNFLKKLLNLYPNNFIIVLANMKTSREDIKKFSDVYDDCHFWNDKFLQKTVEGLSLKLQIHKSKITEIQNIKIKKCNEGKDVKPSFYSWKEDTYRNCKRFCNIVYPYDVQSEIEEAVKTNTTDEYYKSNNPYKMIMRLGGKKEFLYLTPKFNKLLNVLESNNQDRHIIYTSFDSYYGSDILQELLKENFSVMIISSNMSESEKEKYINAWNKNKNYNVLIITTSVPLIPENVNHIHIIDSNMKEIYERIFELCEKKSETLPDLGESLTIHFHTCEKINPEDEKIIDEYTFPVFYEYLSSKKNFWDLVLEKSKNTYLKNSRVIINS